MWNDASESIFIKKTFMTFEQQKNTKALIWTVAVHALLLLVFLLSKYTLPAQAPVEDLGLEVNLGTSENGFGTDQPEDPEDPAAANASVAVNASSSSSSNDREVHTSDDADAPAVHVNRTTPDKKPTPRPVTPTPNRRVNTNNTNTVAKTNTPAQSPRYVYPGATGKGGNSAQNNHPGGNEGIGQGNGDMGVPGGTPGASNYAGVPGGGGTSIGHSISGRNIVSRPDPKAEFREGGKVVIRVTVNRDGAITDSRIVSAANATIRALALKKLQSVRFNKSTTAPAEQFGNITFNFKATRK
jgi:outer membrane biosynthesis protein TonB